MLKFIGIIGNILGIGKDALANRAKLKHLKAEQEFKIIEAQTSAVVDRITSNTDSDNAIDLETARNKRFTIKDEVITYMFLTPVFIATITPFLQAYKSNVWTNLAQDIRVSYESLNALPDWYMVVLFAIVIDVLGFRSFARPFVKAWTNKLSGKLNKKHD